MRLSDSIDILQNLKEEQRHHDRVIGATLYFAPENITLGDGLACDSYASINILEDGWKAETELERTN